MIDVCHVCWRYLASLKVVRESFNIVGLYPLQEMSSNPRYGGSGSFSEDDVSLDDKGSLKDEAFGTTPGDDATPPTVETRRKPKDPRSSAYHKYNIFSRLLFL